MVADYHWNPVVGRLIIRFSLMTDAQLNYWKWEHNQPTKDEREAMDLFAKRHYPAAGEK